MSADNFDEQFEDDENLDDDFQDDFEEDQGFEDEEVEDDFEEGTAGEEYDGSDQGSSDDEEFDKPVSEGETVEVEIEDLGSKGDGIARVEGFVVFVPGGEVGESYEVEVTSVGRKFAFAEITE